MHKVLRKNIKHKSNMMVTKRGYRLINRGIELPYTKVNQIKESQDNRHLNTFLKSIDNGLTKKQTTGIKKKSSKYSTDSTITIPESRVLNS